MPAEDCIAFCAEFEEATFAPLLNIFDFLCIFNSFLATEG